MKYESVGTKFKRKYGKTLDELSSILNVSRTSLCRWEKAKVDIYERARDVNLMKKYGYVRIPISKGKK